MGEWQKPDLEFLRSWVQAPGFKPLLRLSPLGIYGPLGYAGNAVNWKQLAKGTDSLEQHFRTSSGTLEFNGR